MPLARQAPGHGPAYRPVSDDPAAGPEADDLRPVLSRVLPAGWDGPIARGDQAAFDAAVRRAWLVVYFRVAARTGNRATAEEAAQEVFCRVMARMGSGPPDDPVKQAYLARAAHNLLQDQWRRQRHRQIADTAYAGDRSAAPSDPEESVVRRLEAERVARALAALPPLQARVLRLRIVEELSAEETGAVVGRSPAAVRQIQHRALVALRQRLAESEDRG